MDATVKNEIAEGFLEQYGDNAVPESLQEEAAYIRKIGKKPVIVSSAEKNIIEDSDVFQTKKQDIQVTRNAMHPLDHLQAFAARIKRLLSDEQNEELLEIIRQIAEILD